VILPEFLGVGAACGSPAYGRPEANWLMDMKGMNLSAGENVLSGTVLESWVDFNGHMADASYGIVLSDAITAFMDMICIDAEYRRKTNNTLYTMEMRILYLRECHKGQKFDVLMQVIDHDAKRFHTFVRIVDEESGEDVAWGEQLLLHTHQDPVSGPRSCPFPPGIMDKLEAYRAAHRSLEVPPWIGSRIGIRRK
jgi:acyl-CoA thioester hydrolase